MRLPKLLIKYLKYLDLHRAPKLPHEWLHGVPVKAQDTACRSCTKSLINELHHLSPPYPKFVKLWQVKEAGAIDKKAGQS